MIWLRGLLFVTWDKHVQQIGYLDLTFNAVKLSKWSMKDNFKPTFYSSEILCCCISTRLDGNTNRGNYLELNEA